MCKFLLKFVLIAAFVWKTFADYRTLSDNEVFFGNIGSPMEVDDIPEYEIMQWHEPRRRGNLRIVKISEEGDFIPVVNEENANDEVIVPTKTSFRSKIGNFSITLETKPVGIQQSQNISPASTIDKTNYDNEDPPLHRIIVRDEDIKPIIGVAEPVGATNKPLGINKPATTITKPAVSVPKPLASIAKPASTISKPTINISKPVVGVIPTTATRIKPDSSIKPATAISIKQDTSVKPTLTVSKPAASVSKPTISIKPATAISIKPDTSIKPAAIIKPVVNKPSITVSKPGTIIKPVVNKPVTNSQKPVKQDPPKPTSPPAAASINPCKCAYGQCMCCTGPLLDLFSQKACMKVVYIPEDFAFDYALLLNKRVMYQDKISGKNPRPACISIPRFNSLRLCAKFSNIYFAGRNIHMCLGLEGKWNSFELFSTQFDCLRMGAQGFAVVKPEEGGGIPSPGVPGGLDSIIDAGGDDIEDYDENVARWFFGSY